MSTEAEELLELREALDAVADKAEPTANCPDPETIWAAIQGELRPGEMREVVDHVASCLACAEAWEVADDMVASRAGVVRSVVRPTPAAAGSRQLWWLSAAAAVMLLVAGTLWRPWQEWRWGSEYRGPEESVLRSLLPEDEPLPRSDCVLRWEGPEDGLTFDVRVSWVTSGAREVILEEKGLEVSELRIPEEQLLVQEPSSTSAVLLRPLPSDAKLVWRVEAFREGRPVVVKTFVSRLE